MGNRVRDMGENQRKAVMAKLSEAATFSKTWTGDIFTKDEAAEIAESKAKKRTRETRTEKETTGQKRIDRPHQKIKLQSRLKKFTGSNYKISYIDPEDEEGLEEKTWYFKTKEEAGDQREDLAAVWDLSEKEKSAIEIEEV